MRNPLALANLVANVGIVITGSAVRLTGSGLGCPTWPKCTEESYHTTPELGINGVIEYGNRLLSVIVGIIAVLTVLVLWRTAQRRLALVVLGGVLLQGAVGGLTVRFDLSPYLVGPHFLFSMILIALSYRLWRATGPAETGTEPRLRPLTWALAVASALVLAFGVVVTGSGPHAGDDHAVRTGFDPETVSQLHADGVFLLLGLLIAYRFVAASPGTKRKSTTLLIVVLAQGVIGFIQYFTALPALLVGFHVAGACAVWLATLALFPVTAAPRPEIGAEAVESGLIEQREPELTSRSA